MDSLVGLFRGNITPIDRLLKTTVGRKEMLDDLLEKLERNVEKKGGQHYLFIGPRGIGKTHFLTLIENAIKTNENLQKRYTVIRFPEENNRILSFADILLGITEILGEVTDDSDWRQRYLSTSEIEKDEDIIDTIVPKLRYYQKQTGKTLLILLENIAALFTEQIKQEQDIHRFRTFLMDTPCSTLVGTSPVYFPGLYDNKSPLYDFFDIQVLEDLTEEQTLEMIQRNLEWEGCTALLKEFDSLTPKIRTIHIMTGGNPRLIMMLYELVAHDNLLDVKIQFQKLLDQISPFYQDRMKDLAPQERALLETLALNRSEPRTPANIAKHLRKSPQQTSSLLRRMTNAGYLTSSENLQDKRSRIYRIKEGFFDLWLAMSESRIQRKRLGYLVEFFEIYFNDLRERERKRRDLWQQLETEKSEYMKKENVLGLLDYLSDLGDEKERCQTKLELVIHELKEGDPMEAARFLGEVESIAPKSLTFQWMTEQASRWAKGGLDVDVRKWLDELIDYWRTQRSGDLEKAAEIAYRLGKDISGRGLHKIRIELLDDALNHTDDPLQKCTLLTNMARSQKMDGQLEAALNSLQHALTMYKEIGDKEGEGATLNNISVIYDARGEYKTALKYLEESLQISREIGDKEGEGTTLNNISQIYHTRGEYETALEYLEESLQISRKIGNKTGEGATLNNIGSIYKAHGDYEKALKYFEESLKTGREIGDKEGEGATLNNIGGIYKAHGDYEMALKYLEESLQISREIGNKEGEGATLNNISQIYDARSDYEMALKYLEESLQISREIGNKEGEGTTLNNISKIYDARSDYEMALKYLEESLQISREIGDKKGEGTTLNNIGQIYYARGDYEMALKYLEESLQIKKEIGNKKGEGVTLNNISQIYRARSDYKVALKYLEESLKISREIGDKAGEAATLNNIGQIYKARGDYEMAFKYLEESLEIRREIGSKAGLTPTLHNMAMIELQRENIKNYCDLEFEAYRTAIETENAEGMFHVGRILGKILLDIGDREKGIQILRRSYEIGSSTNMPGTEEIKNILVEHGEKIKLPLEE
jgi:tetratricopeptide (TPR) repeat protein/DNA-binding MarR family transcriptional regulator